MKLAIILGLALCPGLALAGTYKCTVNGKIVFSDTACVTGAEAVHIDPIPRDSLDNPETAERYRQQKEIEAQQQLQRQQLELEQKRLQADYELKQKQFELTRELVNKTQGVGANTGLGGGAANATQRQKQEDALKALKAINGVIDVPERR